MSMIEELKAEIEADEGRIPHIYLCPAHHPTFGVGHMIRADDPEKGLPIGSPVEPARIEEAFGQDVKFAMSDCRKLYTGFDAFPPDVQKILANMMFNLGFPRLSGFVRLRAAVMAGNWDAAADEMADSLWHRQLPKRSGRLIARMRFVQPPSAQAG